MDNKFNSRRWMLANNILRWSRLFAVIILLIGVTVGIDHIGSIITGVLSFLGGVHALVYGAYAANRAFTDKDDLP